jgi:ankyrin repeat protein
MRAHCRVDLHDAVCFDLPEHVQARLAEAPGAADRQIDQWDVPHSTALHWAAWCQRPALARLLLEKGANPTLLSGDGRTPLDAAEHKGAAEVADLLRAQGGRRAEELE